MTESKQDNKKPKAFRALEKRAEKGDIRALFQLGQNYNQGRFVEHDEHKANEYFDKVAQLFEHPVLRVNTAKIKHFRCFEAVDINICNDGTNASNLTVIVGNNGAGKTTILRALVNSLSWFISRLKSKDGQGYVIEELDIHNSDNAEYASIIVELQVHDKASFEIALSKPKALSKTSKTNSFVDIQQLADIYKLIQHQQGQMNLPIMAYYPVERASDIINKDIDSFNEITSQQSWQPLDGYTNALNHTSNFRLFFNWFKHFEDVENAQSKPDSDKLAQLNQLKADLDNDLVKTMEKQADLDESAKAILIAYKKDKQQKIAALEAQGGYQSISKKTIQWVILAIEQMMSGFTNLRIERTSRLDMLIDKNGETLNVLQLSQGEKSFMALIGDIARRLVLLNPVMESPLEGCGVVLIDEIDLHLHPKWQQKVLPGLVNTFPNIQFIVTTHSPPSLNHGPS
jgi:predicted ATP-binding protein involved in virulence